MTTAPDRQQRAEDPVEWTLKRLEELRADLARGTTQLAELGRRQSALRDDVLRVEGAIRVLEEQLAAGAPLTGEPALSPGSTVDPPRPGAPRP